MIIVLRDKDEDIYLVIDKEVSKEHLETSRLIVVDSLFHDYSWEIITDHVKQYLESKGYRVTQHEEKIIKIFL